MSELKQTSVALLEKAIDDKIRKAVKGGQSTHLATVTRVSQDGTTWVHVFGGSEETPVRRMTTAASVGDIINVTFSGLSCMGVGNVSSPSATERQVQKVEHSTRTIAAAAKDAWDHADDAAMAAQNAWDHANDAAQAAQTAWDHADEAADAASDASRSADNALVQLSIVEDVAGTLDWISKHGTYTATSDTAVVEGKVYFEYDSTTHDYTPVVSPPSTANPSNEGWYVLDVTDSQSDFIMAHLAVTSRGLWVLPSGIGSSTTPATGESQADSDARQGSGYKLLLSSDGTYIYDGTGALVITYGANITPSANRPFYIGEPNSTSYILFTPASGGSPAHISIGGDVEVGGTTTLSDLIGDVSDAVADATAASQKVDDIPIVKLSATNGTTFKRNSNTTTTLVAKIYTPAGNIENATTLRSRFGNGAYLEWSWRDVITEADHIIVSTDPRIGNGGFTFTVSPSDIESQAVITCTLNC